jgi:hypothetical protein
MPKTLPPGTVELPGLADAFVANVVPDVFDERDLVYRPRLAPLPARVDVRPADRYVLTQEGNSCTGHAVAAMVNAVLATQPDPIRVSPYMLYRMARRYDEWEGEEDAGSSLRGAFKGWFYHGLLPEQEWPALDEDGEPDLDLDERLARLAMRHPLGAFYRVNAYRLDDLQSAVNELNGIAASAAIHSGWVKPTEVTNGSETMHVIERPADASPLGGHAFAVVGYNELGFLVQNSWGTGWGRGGFATLPYDDWLRSAYDAWVARPGVPSYVAVRERGTVVTDTTGGLALGPGPDLFRLQSHVVNLGNDGRLSTTGRFRSSPAQVDRVFRRMRDYHEHWSTKDPGGATSERPPRRIVLYAHGGLNSESTGLTIAHKQLNWWLNNGVYPVTFAWQSGAVESLFSHLVDTVRGKLPFGGLGIDLVEQFDRLVEKLARAQLRWMWDEMKENAAAASRPVSEPIEWPGTGSPPARLSRLPGATLTADRLAAYVRSVPDADVQVHLVGHSAGSIFLAALLEQLVGRGVPVTSIAFLAPALRVDTFAQQVLPRLRDGTVVRFASYGLSDQLELDDACGAKGINVYQKSLLYLVARALERTSGGQSEVPLLGVQRFCDTTVAGGTLRAVLKGLPDADLVWSPSSGAPAQRSSAKTHGAFDDDTATMTSVLVRMLQRGGEPTKRMTFTPNAPLLDAEPTPVPAQAPADTVAESYDAGSVPVTRMAAPQPGDVQVPATGEERLPEEQLAPRASSPVLDALRRHDWRPVTPG